MRLNAESKSTSSVSFNGTNYKDWVDEMAFFLQGKGYWEVITLDPPEPKTGETETSESFIKRYDEWISKDW